MMKKLISALILCVFAFSVSAQTIHQKAASAKVITKQTIDIACGECQFKMKGKDCELALKIDGKSYFVEEKVLMILAMAMANMVFAMP